MDLPVHATHPSVSAPHEHFQVSSRGELIRESGDASVLVRDKKVQNIQIAAKR